MFILTWYLKNDIIFQHAKFQQDRSMVTKVHSMKRKQYFASTLKATHVCQAIISARIEISSSMIYHMKAGIMLFPVVLITQF